MLHGIVPVGEEPHPKGFTVRRRPDLVVFDIEGEGHVGEALRAALDAGAQIVEVTPRRETLEDLFLRRAL